MSIMFFIILLIALIIFAFSIGFYNDGAFDKIERNRGFILAATLVLWCFLSFILPYNNETLTKLDVCDVNDIQCISYYNGLNGVIIKNLNQAFNKVIDTEKEDVVLVYNEGGWYRGIYWMDKYELKLIQKEKE